MLDKFSWEQPDGTIASVPELSLMEIAIDWCNLVGFDSKDEKVFAAFISGAKLALSNNGWQYKNIKTNELHYQKSRH